MYVGGAKVDFSAGLLVATTCLSACDCGVAIDSFTGGGRMAVESIVFGIGFAPSVDG